jgi:RHS repeat-associated protein
MRESIAMAVDAWLRQEYPEAVRLFRDHIAAYPDSPWRAEALLHLGFDSLNNLRFTEAEEHFTTVIRENRTRDSRGARLLRNRAKLGLGNVKVNQHNLNSAKAIFNDLRQSGNDWRERTYADHWLRRLSRYAANELPMLNCGSRALAWLMEYDGDSENAARVRELLPKSREGHSLKDLADIAAQYGYRLDAAKLTPDQISQLSLPVILHVRNDNPDEIGHFWILEQVDGDRLTFFVPREALHFSQSLDEFAREWSGYAVTIADEPLPGIALTESDMAGIYGANGGGGGPMLEDSLGNCDDDDCKQGSAAGGNSMPTGAPAWFVNMVNFNLYLTDIPLWYTPPIGPKVEIRLSYNSQSATATREPFGNKWQFTYNSYLDVQTSGAVVVYMPDGRRDVFNPDLAGGYTKPYRVYNSLVKTSATGYTLTFPDGRVQVYDKPQASLAGPVLTELRDAHGQKLSFGYNAAGQLTTITDATGKTTTLSYNGSGLVTLITDPFGRTAGFQYDNGRNLTKITDMGGYWSAFAYDPTVYLTGITNGADAWQFSIEPSGGTTLEAYPPPGGVMGDNYRVTVTNPAGGKEEYYYAASLAKGLHITPRHYVAYVDSTTNNLAVPRTAYSYAHIGTRGEISSIVQPSGDTMSFTHDYTSGVLTGEADSWGTTSYVRNVMGLPTKITDGKGGVTNLTYQPNNLDLATVVNGLGTITLTFNSSHDLTSLTDRMGGVRTITYNAFGQRTAITDPLGIQTTYSYDVGHFLTQISRGGQAIRQFTYDTRGRVKTVTDEEGVTLSYDYNNLDDIIKITYPDGKFESRSYSGTVPHQLASVTDRSGRITTYTYGKLRSLIRTDFPDGSFVTYTRDANGNMTGFTDTMGNTSLYAYDDDDWLHTKTYADGQVVNFFHEGGLLTADEHNSYQYDANRNVTANGTATFTYDAYDRRTNMSMPEVTDAGLVYNNSTFTYDANSRLIGVDGPWLNDTITVQRDAKGRMTGLSVQGGDPVTYSYDDLDRLTGIQRGTDSYAFTYTGASRLPRKLTRPSGSYTDYQYDNLVRLQSIANMTSSGTVISRHDYTYNSQDQRATETVTNAALPALPAGTTSYGHNNLNQMLTSSAATFTYMNGNLYAEDRQGASYNTVYGFSFMNKTLDTVMGANGIDTYYSYDADRFLLRKRTEGGQVGEARYVLWGNLALQERDAGNAVTREYLWAPGYPGGIGGLLDLKQGGHAYSYLYDGKGNVTALIDSLQAVAVRYGYDPFGVPTTVSGTLTQPYRFSTKPYDDNTGLSYYGYRFYKPDIGRWISRDPLMEQGGLNLYGFVGNDPVNRIDPLGLKDCNKKPPKKETCYLWGLICFSDDSEAEKPKRDLPSDYSEVPRTPPKKDDTFGSKDTEF